MRLGRGREGKLVYIKFPRVWHCVLRMARSSHICFPKVRGGTLVTRHKVGGSIVTVSSVVCMDARPWMMEMGGRTGQVPAEGLIGVEFRQIKVES